MNTTKVTTCFFLASLVVVVACTNNYFIPQGVGGSGGGSSSASGQPFSSSSSSSGQDAGGDGADDAGKVNALVCNTLAAPTGGFDTANYDGGTIQICCAGAQGYCYLIAEGFTCKTQGNAYTSCLSLFKQTLPDQPTVSFSMCGDFVCESGQCVYYVTPPCLDVPANGSIYPALCGIGSACDALNPCYPTQDAVLPQKLVCDPASNVCLAEDPFTGTCP